MICAISFAQQTGIKGHIYDSQSGQPVIYANIHLLGTKYGGITDLDGYYAITNIPAGEYTIQVTYLGYDTCSAKIKIKNKNLIKKDFFLDYTNIMLQEIAISGKLEAQKKETNISVKTVTPKDIKSIPAIGGQADIAQYLEVIPGITSSGDQGGQLFIRGGTPVENKVLLDGMIIYNPFHSIGSASVFDTDIIQNAEILTGGFNARYGGRLSSVIDITTREGNKDKIKGKLDFSTYGSKILFEAPITNKQKKAYNSSIILSVKKGHMNQASDYLEYMPELPFSYEDIYSKITFGGRNGNKLKIFGFSFDDQVNYAVAKYNWNSKGFGIINTFVPALNATIIESNFAYSQYEMQHQDIMHENHSLISSFNAGIHTTNFIQNHQLKHGIEFIGYHTDFLHHNEDNSIVNQIDNTSEINAYFTSKLLLGNIIIEPGLRLNYYGSLPLKRFIPEPRLSAKYLVSENFRIKLGTGLYSQNLISSKSSKDIVNHFYGFLSGNEDIPKEYKDELIKYNQQKSRHIILGAELNLSKSTLFNLEAFYKDYPQLICVNPNKTYKKKYIVEEQPQYTLTNFAIEKGYVKGLDASVEHTVKKYYLWLAYSLSFSERTNEAYTYSPTFDRRHEGNVLLNYFLNKKRNLIISSRWNVASGFPFTQVHEFFPVINYENVNYDNPNNFYIFKNKYGISYDEYNTARLPYYHRVDLSLKKIFKIKNKFTIEGNVGVTNFYDRKNVFYISHKTAKRIDQMPFMLNFGVSIYN